MKKLTKSIIDKLEFDESKSFCAVWDTICPGFGIRVHKRGSKSFFIDYVSPETGKRVIKSIGRYGHLTLDEGRAKAKRCFVKISDGVDPFAVRDEGKTFEAVAEYYLENHSKKVKTDRSYRDDRRQLDKHVLPYIGRFKIDKVGVKDIQLLHTKRSEKAPIQANRMLALVSSIFNKAKAWGFFTGDNPAQYVTKSPERSRDRFLSQEELARVISVIDSYPDKSVSSAIWVCLFTGMRKGEVLGLQWKNVHLKDGYLVVPQTKNKTTLRLPLSGPAINVFKSIKKVKGNPFVFVGRVPGTHRKDIKRGWTWVRSEAGVEDVTIHDLRRTVASLLVQSGETTDLIGKILNHKDTATTKIYARFNDAEVRRGLESFANIVESLKH